MKLSSGPHGRPLETAEGTLVQLAGSGKDPLCGHTTEKSGSRRGAAVFGWDAWFQPQGSAKTFAEMTADEKDKVSHRGKAYRLLAAHLKQANAAPTTGQR